MSSVPAAAPPADASGGLYETTIRTGKKLIDIIEGGVGRASLVSDHPFHAPGKHVPERRGPYEGLLRYHLGLKVPQKKEQCRIRVAGEVRHWKKGGSMVFDDTCRHEVWNDTNEERAILFMGVERPMTSWASLLNKAVIRLVGPSPFVPGRPPQPGALGRAPGGRQRRGRP